MGGGLQPKSYRNTLALIRLCAASQAVSVTPPRRRPKAQQPGRRRRNYGFTNTRLARKRHALERLQHTIFFYASCQYFALILFFFVQVRVSFPHRPMCALTMPVQRPFLARPPPAMAPKLLARETCTGYPVSPAQPPAMPATGGGDRRPGAVARCDEEHAWRVRRPKLSDAVFFRTRWHRRRSRCGNGSDADVATMTKKPVSTPAYILACFSLSCT